MSMTYWRISALLNDVVEIKNVLSKAPFSPDDWIISNKHVYDRHKNNLREWLTECDFTDPNQIEDLASWVMQVKKGGQSESDVQMFVVHMYGEILNLVEQTRGKLDEKHDAERVKFDSLYEKTAKAFPPTLREDAELLAWLLVKVQTGESNGTFSSYQQGHYLGSVEAPPHIDAIVKKGRMRFLENAGFLYAEMDPPSRVMAPSGSFSLTEKALAFLGFTESVLHRTTSQQNQIVESPVVASRRNLRKAMMELLSRNDLDVLCFDLGIEAANLSPDHLGLFAKNLIEYCEKTDRKRRLLEELKSLRPAFDWQFDLWLNA